MGQVVPFPLVRITCPERTTSLDTAECAFLIAVRWWVSGFRSDEDPVPRICEGLKIAGARDAAFSLNAVMAIVADAARRPIAIHDPRCGGLSTDEQYLLFVASVAQSGERGLARRAFRDIQISEPGAELALAPLEELGTFFAEAGLLFTRRRVPSHETQSAGAIEVWTPSPPARTIH